MLAAGIVRLRSGADIPGAQGKPSVGLLTGQSSNSKAYEALYEVEGIKRSNLSGRLLMVSPLHADKIWNSQPAALQFPNG